MSELRSRGKRVLLYVLAALAIAVIAWIVFCGTNVFNYNERANEAVQQQTDEQGD